MEIEAKLRVWDKRTANLLRELDEVAGFTLGVAHDLRMRDTYFDTQSGDLVNSRHVLRVRNRNDGKVLVTFKAPASRRAGVHSRPETEAEMAVSQTPHTVTIAKLPKRIRTVVQPLLQGTDALDNNASHKGRDVVLHPLFSTTQHRQVRAVKKGRTTIAEWSLDRVQFRAGFRRKNFYELEVELKGKGTRADLDKIVRELRREFRLQPEPESKFKRGLDFQRLG
jgi:inorganic triphosphatase YgiF